MTLYTIGTLLRPPGRKEGPEEEEEEDGEVYNRKRKKNRLFTTSSFSLLCSPLLLVDFMFMLFWLAISFFLSFFLYPNLVLYIAL